MLIKRLTVNSLNIDRFEKKYDLVLPQDYIDFLTQYNGGVSQDNSFVSLSSAEISIEIDTLFGIGVKEEWLSVEYWMDKYHSMLPHNSVIIGCDLLKGLFILIFDGSNDGVYYWDSMLNCQKSTEDSNAYFLCKSFNEFIVRIGGIQLTEL